jgi:hypothetical protein
LCAFVQETNILSPHGLGSQRGVGGRPRQVLTIRLLEKFNKIAFEQAEPWNCA